MQKMQRNKVLAKYFYIPIPTQSGSAAGVFLFLERPAMIYRPAAGKARIVFYRAAQGADEVDHKT